MAASSVTVSRVKDKRDFEDFLRLPWKVYRGDLYWVPPFLKELKDTFNSARNPFLQHADMELLLARKDGKAVGRIVGIIDANHNQFHQEKTGFFGFFESLPDYNIAEALLSEAKRWCQQGGMNILRGPVNLSMNDECAFLLDGFDSSPVIMMPYNPQYYLDFMDRYGFRKAKDLYAFLKDQVGVPDRIAKLVERIKRKEHIVIRHLDMKNLDREIAVIKDIYNTSWEKNWGFVPMTEAEMDLMAKRLKPLIVPELVLIAEVKGEPVGVSITVPDYNQVLKRLDGKLGPVQMLKFLYYRRKITGVRSLVFGIKKEYRRTGINTVLYYETERAGAKLGYRWGEMSWNLEDNDLINRFDAAVGGKLYKKYRIYEMEI